MQGGHLGRFDWQVLDLEGDFYLVFVFILFIFLAVLGLRCWTRAYSGFGKPGVIL